MQIIFFNFRHKKIKQKLISLGIVVYIEIASTYRVHVTLNIDAWSTRNKDQDHCDVIYKLSLALSTIPDKKQRK